MNENKNSINKSSSPITPVNFAATASADILGECMHCEKLKNSLKRKRKRKF